MKSPPCVLPSLKYTADYIEMRAEFTRFLGPAKTVPYICALGTKEAISTKPVLLVVAYRGGNYFKECVESVKPCVQYFSSSIIFINGSEPEDDLHTASAITPLLKTSIFATGKDFSAIEHSNLIQRQLHILLDPGQHIFVLCHDDRLVHDSFCDLKPDDWLRNDPSLSLGNYAVFNDNGHVRYESAFHDRTSTQPTANRAQWRDSLGNARSRYTNASGMRMPSQVLIEAAKYQVRTRSEKGLRSEYICAAHHLIDVLYYHNPPLVAIREHSASEGANKTNLQYHGSELRYIIWLFINCRSFDEIRKLLRSNFGLHYFFENLAELVPLRYSGKRGGRLALVIGRFLQRLSLFLKP